MHDASDSNPPRERLPLWRRLVGPLLVLAFAAVVYNFSNSRSRVSGTVSVAGQTLSYGTITFHPVSSGTPATGDIGDRGEYEAFTDGEPGLASGEYLVTISPPPDLAPPEGHQPAAMQVPERFTSKATTTLRTKVPAGSIQLNFNLPKSKDAPR